LNVERRGRRFLLTALEAELHDAATTLGFIRDREWFVREFPPNAKWLEEASSDFVRYAPTMLRQTASGVAPWDGALLAFLDRVDGVGWWLAGSAALAVRGVAVSPRELDVITDRAGAERLGELLTDRLVEPVSAGDTWVARWWGRAFLGAGVEWGGRGCALGRRPGSGRFRSDRCGEPRESLMARVRAPRSSGRASARCRRATRPNEPRRGDPRWAT
jgi:hypothetical protein